MREFVNKYLAIPQENLNETWNNGFPLLNRLLWAKLDDLPPQQINELTSRFTSKKYLLRADHKMLKQIFIQNQKREKPIDFFKHIYEVSRNCVHNGFHIEALFFAKKLKETELEKHLHERLEAINNYMLNNDPNLDSNHLS